MQPMTRSLPFGVGHNEDPLPPVRGTDACSRNNQRPAGVACCFQVRKHVVERQLDDSRHILTKNPSGSHLGNEAEHLWPEMAVIALASSPSGHTEWLARESATDEGDLMNACCLQRGLRDTVNVLPDGNAGPVRPEHLTRKLSILDKADRAETRTLCGQIDAANAAEQGQVGQVYLDQSVASMSRASTWRCQFWM